jgi:hypothetical protein
MKRILEEKRQEKQDNRDNSATTSINPAISAQNIGNPSLNSPLAPPSMNALNTTASVFYFYNPTTVSFGKIEFKKMGKSNFGRQLENVIGG